MNKKKISKKVLILSGNKKIFGFTTITKMAKTHIFIPKSQSLLNSWSVDFVSFSPKKILIMKNNISSIISSS